MPKRTRFYTLGYQGESLRALCERLLENDVELLIDVRERAWSHRPEFRKTALRTGLEASGIGYEHARSAGNPFRPRGGEKLDRDVCLRQYRDYLAENPEVVDELLALAKGRRVAFFCYEEKAEDCHRGVLVKALAARNPKAALTHL